MKTLSVRLSDEVFARLQGEAEKRDLTLSEVIRIRLAAGGSPWEWHTTQPFQIGQIGNAKPTTQNAYAGRNLRSEKQEAER